MSTGANDALLTCAETPLAWPSSVDLSDIKVSKTSALNIFAPAAGSLQILTRRQGGAGDGVNIEESPTVGADFRGQRYSLEEVVFHTPGLHVFPGQTAVYPAELHVHMRTFSAPQRGITIVVPVSHLVDPSQPGQAYFAAAAAQPDPSAVRPALTSLLPPGTPLLIYRGPDLRGRTADAPTTDQCAADAGKRDFLLVLDVAFIRAMDLERIPREGSLSTDPRDLPAPGIAPTETLLRDRIIRTMTLAKPGLPAVFKDTPTPPSPTTTEMECKPITVVNGRDVIDVSGKPMDLAQLLGFDVSGGPSSGQPSTGSTWNTDLAHKVLLFFGTAIGLLIADALVNAIVWQTCFDKSGELLGAWEPFKIWIYLTIALGAAGLGGSFFTLANLKSLLPGSSGS